jgi:hypothetical protein
LSLHNLLIRMTPVEAGTVVGIFAEGKVCTAPHIVPTLSCQVHPLAVGKTSMSTKEIKEKNKGVRTPEETPELDNNPSSRLGWRTITT